MPAESHRMVRCSACKQFSYYANEQGHNSPHAMGKCGGTSWDGNRGQWAMFQHPCERFLKPTSSPDKDG
jgi:hypothetical protein